MWTRPELKSLAKSALKGNYWKSFFISIVILIAGGGNGGGTSGYKFRKEDIEGFINFNPNAIGILITIALLILAFRLLIGYSLEVGGMKYFVRGAQYKNTDGCIGFAFDGQNFKGIVSAMFLRAFYIFLWSLLYIAAIVIAIFSRKFILLLFSLVLIIPSIVKVYAYYMVPYILSDNPNIGAKRAIELSNEMMMGNKFELFCLELSFIGWILLGLLAFGIGVLFVNPYMHATHAQLYLVLRRNVLESNYTSYEELKLEEDFI